MNSYRLFLAFAVFVTAVGRVSAGGAEFMFRANVNGEVIEGKPLTWNSHQMLLLARDGQMHEFDPKLAKDAEKTSPTFVPYTAAEMKTKLQQEFGSPFEVTETRHYLVVHPHSERDEWAERFEDLYSRFGHYFRVRGFEMQEPICPLVAVVFRNHDEYFRHAAATGTPMHPNTLGHYDPITNRVFLFDVTAGKHKKDWSENAITIIHEATHQSAFNSGVHRRFAVEPRWLVEGLATMFEAPGVWSARYDHTQADRINRGRLDGFRKYVKSRRQPGSLTMLLTTDNAFQSDPDGAYAEAWALSFYLSETRPRQYAEYLAKTAGRPLFVEYTAGERMADFQLVFGADLKMFEARFLHYMQDLK